MSTTSRTIRKLIPVLITLRSIQNHPTIPSVLVVPITNLLVSILKPKIGRLKGPSKLVRSREVREKRGKDGTVVHCQSLGEVNDLLNSATDAEKSASGRTRGANVDAWKQDRELDQAFKERGLADAVQDVEIGRAVGNE